MALGYDEIFVKSDRYSYGGESIESEEEFFIHVNLAGESWEYFPRRVELPVGYKVLGFGSGLGFTLEYLRNAGIDPKGIYPSGPTSTFSAAKGHSVLSGYLEHESFPNSHFDVVHIRATAHLVPNIIETFRIFHRIIKEDGYIFWTGRQLHWSVYNIKGHFMDGVIATIFSSASIRNFCSLSGFQVIGYRNRFGRYRLVAQRITQWQRLTGSN